MKNITTLIFTLLFSIGAFASEGTFITKELRKLGRVQSLTIGPEKLEAGIIITDRASAYYFFPESTEHYLRIINRTKGTFRVELLSTDSLISFNVSSATNTGTFPAEKIKIKVVRDLQGETGLNYWADFRIFDAPAEKLTVTLNSPLYSDRNVAEVVTVSGPMQFNPCDGCERGDQMMINNVNVADLDFGDYYEMDCGGRVERLLSQLLTDPYELTGLSVPFTFKGMINMNTTDLNESVGDLWNADYRLGEIYLGTSEVTLKGFLDSIISKAAQMSNSSVESAKADILQSGEFTGLDNDVLTFKYKNIVIKTNIQTGEMF